jgi:hypothetical protein
VLAGAAIAGVPALLDVRAHPPDVIVPERLGEQRDRERQLHARPASGSVLDERKSESARKERKRKRNRARKLSVL